MIGLRRQEKAAFIVAREKKDPFSVCACRQADIRTGRQAHIQTGMHTYRQACTHTDRHTYRQTGTDKQTYRHFMHLLPFAVVVANHRPSLTILITRRGRRESSHNLLGLKS
eukprot:GHVU01082294.1.p1 GENE.GHVU01082294.1~~GHVU01082294.1.p1  ORF type:complete len:111 (+),score=9.05 GHVU01082294.1:103-435(+)